MGQWKKVIIGAIVISVILGFAGGFFLYETLDHNRIVEGVKVNGLDLSGLTQDQAKERLDSWQKEEEEKKIILQGLGNEWAIRYKDLGYEVDSQALVKDAYEIGRQGNILQQFIVRREIAKDPVDLQGHLDFKEEAVETIVSELTKDLLKPPQNAYFQITPTDEVKVVSGASGEKVVMGSLKADIRTAITKGEEPTLQLQVEEVPPEQTREDVEALGIKGLVTQFSTTFDAKQVDRSYNVHVAASALNGLLIKPGDTISFNEIVGPRSSEAGYREAPVIINNELVPGLGGGVCQVSTTLYNSLLLGNFEILERINHSIPVSYAPLGRDATVAYGWIDFRFKNNRDTYVYLKADIKGNRLTFKVFADPEDNKEVEIIDQTEEVIEPKVVKVEDPNLEVGKEVVKEEGRKGYKTTTIRITKEEGKVVKREVVSKSFYRPKDKTVAVGTKPWSPTVQVPSNDQNPVIEPQPEQEVPADPTLNPDPANLNPIPDLQNPIEEPTWDENETYGDEL